MSDLAAKLEALRTRFRQRLADELRAAERLATGEATAENRQELRERAHKLAGISATMGCPRLSQIARNIDRELGSDAVEAAEFHRLAGELTQGIRGELES
jgi:HPt (histidine-containing phosphotransfer) domain-containing protein